MATNVNAIELDGAAASSIPQVKAVGSDTDVDLQLVPQGAGVNLLNPIAAISQSMGAGVHADVTATARQKAAVWLKLTGTPDAGVNFIVANSGLYMITNASGQTVTVKTAAGTGIAIANTKSAWVAADGTNVIRITADT